MTNKLVHLQLLVIALCSFELLEDPKVQPKVMPSSDSKHLVCIILCLIKTNITTASCRVFYRSKHMVSEILQGKILSTIYSTQKSRIRETKNLSTDADSRTDTIL